MIDADVNIRRDARHHEPWALVAWDRLETAIAAFKEKMRIADCICSELGELPESASSEIQRIFDLVVHEMHVQIGNQALNSLARQELGFRVQAALLPWLRCGDIVDRCYSKPRGYAGDYEVIERLYANQPRGTGLAGTLIDRCFLNTVPAHIVRGRRKLFADEIAGTVMEKMDITRVCVIASGPASEVFDAFQLIPNRELLEITLIDFDAEALSFVAERSRRMGLEKQISLLNENPALIAMGRTQIPLAGQDLVYSLGLVDYFNDRLAVKLLNVIHRMLRQGGRGIVGNYHPVNPARELMEFLLDWKLIHRTEADMNHLFRESAFGMPCTRIRFEEQGVDLFAECKKAVAGEYLPSQRQPAFSPVMPSARTQRSKSSAAT